MHVSSLVVYYDMDTINTKFLDSIHAAHKLGVHKLS